MQLYFAPFAASFACRALAYELGLELEYLQVDRFSKAMADGSDYRAVYAPAFVPALRLDDGRLLTENPVVLAYLASLVPAEKRVLEDSLEVRQWLSYIATELHKAIFHPLFDAHAPPEVKAYALVRAESRLAHIEDHLAARHAAGQAFLGDALSPADFYLATMLMWTRSTPIHLREQYPALARFSAMMMERPSMKRARHDEAPLYAAAS